MCPQQTTTLTEILSDVLADLAFMMIEDERVTPPDGEDLLETTISYRGPREGSLVLRCSRGFSRSLAANLLGLDPDDPDVDSRAEDAVSEFMNIICGQSVTRLFGTEEIYDLSIPEVHTIHLSPQSPTGDESSVAILNIDGHWVQLQHQPLN